MPEAPRGSVLVVDDTEAVRYALVRTLRHQGYEVLEADTAREGLELARARRPDVILLDVRLPDRSGFDVVIDLKADPATVAIPVVQISASFVDVPSRVQGLKAGADAYLTHPVPPPLLAATVAAMLRVREGSRALAESEARFRALAEHAPVGIVFVGAGGETQFVNEAFCQIAGLDGATAKRDGWLRALAPEDRERALSAMESEVASSPDGAIEARVLRPTGELRYVQVSKQPLRSPLGSPLGYIASVQDVTDRRLAEERVHYVQKSQAIGHLAGGMAHELNNRLTAVLAAFDFALARLPSDAPVRRDLEGGREAAEHAAAITQQVLAFSRRQILVPSVLDVAEFVASLEPTLRECLGPAHRVEVRLASDSARVLVDRAQLEQAIVHLASNARDAMRGPGRFTVTTERVELRPGGAGPHDLAPGSYVLIRAEDSGAGMDVDTRAKAFEPFFTTKAIGAGTGLGLSMVQGIVRQSGGEVELDSEPGRGTTVRIYLPLCEAPGATATAGAVRGGSGRTGRGPRPSPRAGSPP